MAKTRIPELAISCEQIVAHCFGKKKPHFLCIRALKPKEKRAIVKFVNEKYRPKPDARREI